MKLRIIVLAVLCLTLKFDGYSQEKDTRGIINNNFLLQNFEFIPYTGPTGPPEYVKLNTGNQNADFKKTRAQIIDSLIIEDIIPAGSTYIIKYDHLTNSFIKTSPVPDLAADAITAINSSPKWLRNDLYDNLRRLDTTLQKEYAQVIINADVLYRDEVAFQVAHLSTNMTLPTLDKRIPLVNAQGIYQIAPDLQYVKLVEHGSAPDGDWYTTTSYRIIDDKGDSVWREIPKEIYYWYVLMPIVYEEQPRMDDTVNNEFWRTYVYNNADPGYPVLKDVLKGIKVLWDGKNYHWDNRDGNAPLPFGDSLSAVQALGRWVAQTITEDAIAPRPVQPNVTLYDHNGNCGEIEQLQTSGGRAALFPLLPVCSLPGDHIWNEIYWPDSARWAFYQIARVGGPTDINWTQKWSTSACITAMRADGYRWMVNENYNPVCTVTVVVRDDNALPVDGAEVIFLAPPYSDPKGTSQVYIGSWGHTDEKGELTVKLATDFNYYIRADWKNGHAPHSIATKYTKVSYSELTPGGHIWISMSDGENTAQDVTHNVVPAPQPDKQSIVVEYEIPYQITYGGSFWNFPDLWQDNFIYAKKTEAGSISSFICDVENFNKYNSNTEFDAFTYINSSATGQMSLNLKDQEDYHIGFSNKSKLNIAQFAKIKVYLYDGPTSVTEPNPNTGIKMFPNPSDGIFYVENLLNTVDDGTLDIINSVGSLVYQSHLNRKEIDKKINLSDFPKGIYLLRVYNKENTAVKKFIIQ